MTWNIAGFYEVHGLQLRLAASMSAIFNVKNLLDTPLRYYEGSPDRPIQREFYDLTYEGGARAKF